MIIKISDYIYDKVEKFAYDRIDGSGELYNNRGKSSNSKMIIDVITGTLGEYAVSNYLRSTGINCTKPDLKIYAKGKKSYAADLRCDCHDIHVKSQTIQSQKRYGNSWLFQRYDSLYAKPEATDTLAFTCVNLETREVTIIGFTKATDILDNNLWGECKVPSFRRTKVALYLKDFDGYDIVKEHLED